MLKLSFIWIVACAINGEARSNLPIVINTWRFVNATKDGKLIKFINKNIILCKITKKGNHKQKAKTEVDCFLALFYKLYPQFLIVINAFYFFFQL